MEKSEMPDALASSSEIVGVYYQSPEEVDDDFGVMMELITAGRFGFVILIKANPKSMIHHMDAMPLASGSLYGCFKEIGSVDPYNIFKFEEMIKVVVAPHDTLSTIVGIVLNELLVLVLDGSSLVFSSSNYLSNTAS